jgi:hypothetical protein
MVYLGLGQNNLGAAGLACGVCLAQPVLLAAFSISPQDRRGGQGPFVARSLMLERLLEPEVGRLEVGVHCDGQSC